MICPYCNQEMEKGVIRGDRYALKWVSDEEDYPFLRPRRGIKLTSFFDTNSVTTYHCPSCKKLIIDLEETLEKE